MPPPKKNKNAKSEIRERYVFETKKDLLEWIRDHLSINADTSYDIQDHYSEGQKVDIVAEILEDDQRDTVGEESINVWVNRRD
jgi:ribosomal protein L3